MYVQKSGYCGYRGFQAPFQNGAFFVFGAKTPGPEFRGNSRERGPRSPAPHFQGFDPPLGTQPLRAGPRWHSAVPGRAVAEARGSCAGAAVRGAAGLGGGRCGHTRSRASGAGGAVRRHTPGDAGRGRAGALARKPGCVSEEARGLGGRPGRGGAAACGPNAAKSGRGPGARRRPSEGGVPGGGGGAGPGRRRWTLRHSKLSPAACVGSWAHPGGAGSAARRKGAFSLYKEARRSAGFSLSNQSCSGPITLCFRSGCFFGGAE